MNTKHFMNLTLVVPNLFGPNFKLFVNKNQLEFIFKGAFVRRWINTFNKRTQIN